MLNKGLVFNPYMPFWEYVPDGEPHVFNDRLYVYGSHDARDGASYCTRDYVVWSAPVDDLSDWRFEGVSYRRVDDPRYAAVGGKDMMAPDCCQGPDGRFYLFYFNDMVTLSVAVSDVPQGPFTYLGFVQDAEGSPLEAAVFDPAGNGEMDLVSPKPGMRVGQAFDPGILSDESGNWLYYGFDQSKFRGPEKVDISGAYVVELEDDLLTVKGEPKQILPGFIESKGTPYEGHAFFEASSIRHIGDVYYFVYSSELGHELCYATSKNPDGPFEYGGVIISFVDAGYRGNTEDRAYAANTHGGMVEVEGQWYIFYHRHTHELQFSRQGCAEPIQIAPDGSIAQVEVTSCGLNGGPLPTGNTYPAHIFCGFRGPEGTVHISTRVHRRANDPFLYQEGADKTGYMCMKNLWSGASATAKYFSFTGEEAECGLECRGSFEGKVEVRLLDGEENEQVIGSVSVSPSKDWVNNRGLISVPAGTCGVRFVPEGVGVLDIKSFSL